MSFSVHTNYGAMEALDSLRSINSSLTQAEKQVSTGYRVADAVDNGAAYAIAQNLRSSVAGVTAANTELGKTQGLLSVTLAGLTSASEELVTMRALLVSLASDTDGSATQTADIATYASDLVTLKSFFTDASYNSINLLDNYSGSSSGFTSFGVVVNDLGTTYHIGYYSTSQVYSQLCLPSTTTATNFAALITAGGTFTLQMDTIGTWLAAVSDQVNYINNQISFNSNKIDALNEGIGALVDADLAAESALLTSLQIRQQLAEQALSIANASPSALMSLFK